MYTRRTFGKVALAGLPAVRLWPAVNSTFHGVRIGVQSASFTRSGFTVDGIVKTMVDIGLAEADVMSQHFENYLGGPVELPGGAGPQAGSVTGQNRESNPSQTPGAPGRARGQGRAPRDPAAREALRKWRLTVPLEGFRSIGKKFTDAGLSIFSYNLSFQNDYTDEEIDRGFQMTQALGTKTITASSPVSVFPRLVPFAEKYKITVAGHNHSNSTDPNELGGPAAFDKIMSLSRYFGVNLDIGHFVALNFDPLPYIRQHHARITNLHLKDRTKNLGPTVEWGTGDTPIKAVLQLLKKEKYPLLACIEQTGPEGPPFVLRKCLEFCKEALA